jgi:hypothetical protein
MEAEMKDKAGTRNEQLRSRTLQALVVATATTLGVNLCAALVEAEVPLPPELERQATTLDGTGRGAVMRKYLKLAQLAKDPRIQAAYAKMQAAQAPAAIAPVPRTGDAGSAPVAPSTAGTVQSPDAAAALSTCATNLTTAATTTGDGKDTSGKSICASCTGPSTLCLNASNGKQFCPGPPLRAVSAGQTLTINVFGVKDVDQPGQVSVTVTTFAPSDGLTDGQQDAGPDASADASANPSPAPSASAPPSGSDADAMAQIPQLDAACKQVAVAPKVAFIQVVSKSVQVPTDNSIKYLTVTTTNQRDDVGSGSVQVAVNHGFYYLEAGFLISFIPGGSRKVNTSPLPGTGGQKTITVANDLEVTPAIVLNAFPWGRRRALFSPFEVPDRTRSLGDLIGIQGGVGLNFSQAPTFLFGAVIEPVSGLSFNGGLVLLQGQFVPPNYAANMLLPQGETLTPDTRYMPRGYFGVTATTDVVNLLTTALGATPHLSL